MALQDLFPDANQGGSGFAMNTPAGEPFSNLRLPTPQILPALVSPQTVRSGDERAAPFSNMHIPSPSLQPPLVQTPQPQPMAENRGSFGMSLPPAPSQVLRDIVSPRMLQEHNLNEQLTKLQWHDQNHWGTANNHPGFWGKLAHIASVAGQVAGTAFAPGIMAAIPGTKLNHGIEEDDLQRQLAGYRQEDRADDQASDERVLRREQAAQIRQDTLNGSQLADAERDSIHARTDALLHPQTPNPFGLWQQELQGAAESTSPGLQALQTDPGTLGSSNQPPAPQATYRRLPRAGQASHAQTPAVSGDIVYDRNSVAHRYKGTGDRSDPNSYEAVQPWQGRLAWRR